MSTISEDILHELLSLLPSRDLLRLRCVSKSWRDLIDSPYFIQLHLNKSLKDIKSQRVLVITGNCIQDEDCDCIEDVDGDCIENVDILMEYRFYAISFDSEFKIVVTREIKPPIQNIRGLECIGSCRSLICLKLIPRGPNSAKIVVWNPSTHSHRIVPFAPVEIQRMEDPNYAFYYAFRYDEVVDDYKVARVTFGRNNGDYEVKVYSLKSDTWKEIDKVPIQKFSPLMSRGPFLANGAIIWYLRELGQAAFSLLVLCLRNDVLQLVSFPDDLCKFNFDFEHCCPHHPRISSCVFRGCYCRFRDVLKLINNKKSDTLTDLLLPDSDINDGMGYLKDSLHAKLCSELQSCVGKICSKTLGVRWKHTCCWVDSLLRVDRSTNMSKMRTAHQLVETKACKRRR